MLSAAALLFLFASLSNGFLLDISTPSTGGGSSCILDRNYKILVDLIADERRSRERLETSMGQLQIATKKLLDSTSTLQNETAVLKEHYQQLLSENLQMKNIISQLETNSTLRNQTKSNLKKITSMEKENKAEFDQIEIQLNRSQEMPGNKMKEFRKYIENVKNNFTTLQNNLEVQMGIYNICESASVDGECRFNCITYFKGHYTITLWL